MKKPFDLILNSLIFIIGLVLIVVNQQTVGMTQLGLMTLGLALLLYLVYRYNRNFK